MLCSASSSQSLRSPVLTENSNPHRQALDGSDPTAAICEIFGGLYVHGLSRINRDQSGFPRFSPPAERAKTRAGDGREFDPDLITTSSGHHSSTALCIDHPGRCQPHLSSLSARRSLRDAREHGPGRPPRVGGDERARRAGRGAPPTPGLQVADLAALMGRWSAPILNDPGMHPA